MFRKLYDLYRLIFNPLFRALLGVELVRIDDESGHWIGVGMRVK